MFTFHLGAQSNVYDIVDEKDNHSTEFEYKQVLTQFKATKKEITALKQENTQLLTVVFFFLSFLFSITTLFLFKLYRKQKLISHQLEKNELEKHALHTKLTHTIEEIEEKTSIITKNESVENLLTILNERHIDNNKWTKVFYYYNNINNGFINAVKQKHPKITATDLQFLVLMKLKYSIKEIAAIRNISESGVKMGKRRLVQKLGINHVSELKF
jgi:DNA-binding CsgD family transcriptional regulator